MKKILTLFLAIICVMLFCINTFALENTSNIVSYDNVDVIFDSNSTLSYEEKLLISNSIVNSVSDIQTYGLVCNLLGHKNSTELVISVTHQVNTTAPRCLREKWEVTTCSRCNNVETTRIGSAYIYCCD